MRHAIPMFVSCLAVPHAAFACMPMEGVSGTQSLVSTLSLMLGIIYLLIWPVQVLRRRNMQPDTPAYARATRHIGFAWKVGLGLFWLPFIFSYGDMLMLSLLIIGFYALGLAVVATIKLAAYIMRKINFSQIRNENSFTTRRFAAAGDVK